MMGIISDSVYHFEYPIFLSLPHLMTEVSSLDDLLNRMRTLLVKVVRHYTSGHK